MVAVTSPTNAKFAVYEDYTEKEYYATYTMDRSGDPVDVYLVILNIRIVDLTTGQEIFSEAVRSNPPPDEIKFTTYYGIGGPVDGKHYHYDFDYEKYTAVLLAHI